MVNAEINDDQHSLKSAFNDAGEQKSPSLGAAFDYIEGICQDFSELPEIHESVLDEIVDDRMSKLKSLAQIDKETANRIAPIAAENIRFCTRERGPPRGRGRLLQDLGWSPLSLLQ